MRVGNPNKQAEEDTRTLAGSVRVRGQAYFRLVPIE